MSDEAESILKGNRILTDVRKAVERFPNLKDELQESMSEPITTLAERFTAMKLKDEPILVYNGAPDVDIDTVFKQLHCIDPELKMDKLTKEVLEASPPLKSFLESIVVQQITASS